MRWDEAPSAALACLSTPTSAVNHRQAIILLLTATCQSTSASETHSRILTFSPVSVAWLRVLPQWPGTDVRAAVCLFPSQEDTQQSQKSHKKCRKQTPLWITYAKTTAPEHTDIQGAKSSQSKTARTSTSVNPQIYNSKDMQHLIRTAQPSLHPAELVDNCRLNYMCACTHTHT